MDRIFGFGPKDGGSNPPEPIPFWDGTLRDHFRGESLDGERMKKTWEEFHGDVKKLIQSLGKYRPDVICPFMLGGLIPGTIVAKELGIRDVRPIDIERVGDERKLVYDVQGNLDGKRVLIIEDDLPTGKGSVFAKKMFQERGARVKIAAVYVNDLSKEIADYYGEHVKKIPNYPWKKHNAGDRVR